MLQGPEFTRNNLHLNVTRISWFLILPPLTLSCHCTVDSHPPESNASCFMPGSDTILKTEVPQSVRLLALVLSIGFVCKLLEMG